MHYKVWGENTYPFPNFNGATVEVWEWISNFIPHFTTHVITNPCWDWHCVDDYLLHCQTVPHTCLPALTANVSPQALNATA